ncbi:MAG: mechanosensitive ion channel family protein [Candidatus Diapherotrites archaeon]|nr:mechanosensitive ion channel family protein [Candidatus Diapherotrites archaeon]
MGLIDQNFQKAGTALVSLTDTLNSYLPTALTIILAIVVIFVVYKLVSFGVHKSLQRFKEEDRATVEKMWRYAFAFLAAVVILLTFSGNLGLTGVTLGLLSAALGFSLQKPIAGIVGWLMILIKKPFKIGDRIIIDTLKGDIEDITMFYLVLREVGGMFESEAHSGRTILIPTSVIFEKPVINYRFMNQFVLKEIHLSVTYESNLTKAQEIMMDVAKEKAGKYIAPSKMDPHTRTKFAASSVDINLRFPVPPPKMDKIAHEITEEIHARFRKTEDVEFAYPHMEIVFKKGTKLERN